MGKLLLHIASGYRTRQGLFKCSKHETTSWQLIKITLSIQFIFIELHQFVLSTAHGCLKPINIDVSPQISTKTDGCISRLQQCGSLSEYKRTTVPSPMIWIWSRGLHLRAAIQYNISFYLMILRPSKTIARLHCQDNRLLIRITLISSFPEKWKTKSQALVVGFTLCTKQLIIKMGL